MKTLLMFLALPIIAACQNPSWQVVSIGGLSCGALMRSPVLVQVYCYSDATNKTMGWNMMTRPILPNDPVTAILIPKNAQFEVGDPYNVPIGGIRWDFEAVPTGIRWTMRQATPGGAGVITVTPISSTGIFTKIYGQ